MIKTEKDEKVSREYRLIDRTESWDPYDLTMGFYILESRSIISTSESCSSTAWERIKKFRANRVSLYKSTPTPGLPEIPTPGIPEIFNTGQRFGTPDIFTEEII